MLDQFSVSGLISHGPSAVLIPVVGATVRAFDKDLPSLNRDQLLGESITNAYGIFKIAFTKDKCCSRILPSMSDISAQSCLSSEQYLSSISRAMTSSSSRWE